MQEAALLVTEEYRKNFRKEELDSLRIYFQSRVRDINFSAVDLRNFTSEQLLRYGIYVINSERSLSYTGKLLVSTISYSFMEWVRTNRVKRINALIFEDAPGEFFARTPFKEIYFNIFLSSNITSLTYLFSGCEELIRAPYINTCFVTGMYGMFDGCTRLKEIPVYNTSRVNCMSFMFANCSSLTAIPSLRTSEVADMNGMFSGCLSLKEVPAMDTGRVNNMSDMFCDCRASSAKQLFPASPASPALRETQCHGQQPAPVQVPVGSQHGHFRRLMAASACPWCGHTNLRQVASWDRAAQP